MLKLKVHINQNIIDIKKQMKKHSVAVIGLGYVGLPLAIEFSKKFKTIGFDININRVNDLLKGIDSTLEVSSLDLKINTISDNFSDHDKGLFFTSKTEDLKAANVFIVTVPTPVDKNNKPDLSPLISASETLGKVISKGSIVIYESTVFPGATEDICVPILEKSSGLKFNKDFFAGYSPERINPGDKVNKVNNIIKVTSGSNNYIGKVVDDLYSSIIDAGTHLAPSIKVAEAAKVIENAQRDINIAFVNELSKIFNLLDINTQDVLDAASTKWNFLKFSPGLVGGHCIGVDPYYLAQIAQENGYHPEIILSGRRLNDSMGKYVADQVVKLMIKKGKKIKNSKILVLGITFKENCPDFRNTKVIDLINELKDYSAKVKVFDPWVDLQKVKKEFNIEVFSELPKDNFDTIVHAVSHNEFKVIDFKSFKQKDILIFDVKGSLGKISDASL